MTVSFTCNFLECSQFHNDKLNVKLQEKNVLLVIYGSRLDLYCSIQFLYIHSHESNTLLYTIRNASHQLPIWLAFTFVAMIRRSITVFEMQNQL